MPRYQLFSFAENTDACWNVFKNLNCKMCYAKMHSFETRTNALQTQFFGATFICRKCSYALPITIANQKTLLPHLLVTTLLVPIDPTLFPVFFRPQKLYTQVLLCTPTFYTKVLYKSFFHDELRREKIPLSLLLSRLDCTSSKKMALWLSNLRFRQWYTILMLFTGLKKIFHWSKELSLFIFGL